MQHAAASDRATIAAFLATVLFAGVNAVAVRFSNAELAPFWGAALRFGSATLIFAALAVVWRVPLPRGRALVGATLFGVLGFGIAYALLYVGLRDAPAAVGQLMLALVPLTTIPLAVVHRLERFDARVLVGALVSAAGIGVIFADQISLAVPLLALLALVLAPLATAESTVVVKFFPGIHPVSTNLVGMAVGTLLLTSLSVASGETWTLPTRPETWLAVAYLVVVGSVVVFLLAMYVLARWSATKAAYQFLLLPVVTVIAGVVLRGEPILPSLVIGGAIVVLGVYVGAFARVPGRARRGDAAAPC
jgi:drug/metabolite transporter (DMT)-like permease